MPVEASQAVLCRPCCSAERHAADAWLQAFTGTPDAWQALLQLLADPAAAEHEVRACHERARICTTQRPSLNDSNSAL